jgi:hypothetical protein
MIPEQRRINSLIAFADAVSTPRVRLLPCAVCGEDYFYGNVSNHDLANCGELLQALRFTLCGYHVGREAHQARLMQHGLADVPLELAALSDNQLTICKWCFSSMRASARPDNCIANGLNFGDVPDELQGLTITEQIMIAPYR